MQKSLRGTYDLRPQRAERGAWLAYVAGLLALGICLVSAVPLW